MPWVVLVPPNLSFQVFNVHLVVIHYLLELSYLILESRRISGDQLNQVVFLLLQGGMGGVHYIILVLDGVKVLLDVLLLLLKCVYFLLQQFLLECLAFVLVFKVGDV